MGFTNGSVSKYAYAVHTRFSPAEVAVGVIVFLVIFAPLVFSKQPSRTQSYITE